jgi:hypothetical protein
MVRALALWLNASITAQKAAEKIGIFFLEIMFIFTGNFMLCTKSAAHVPDLKHY